MSKSSQTPQGDLNPLKENENYLGSQVPLSPEVCDLLKRAIEVQEELDLRKKFYEEMNEIALRLVSLGFVEGSLGESHFTLKDNFAKSNVGWTSAAVRRFELEVIPQALQEKRMKRKAKEAL